MNGRGSSICLGYRVGPLTEGDGADNDLSIERRAAERGAATALALQWRQEETDHEQPVAFTTARTATSACALRFASPRLSSPLPHVAGTHTQHVATPYLKTLVRSNTQSG